MLPSTALPVPMAAAAIAPALLLLWLAIAVHRRPEPPGLVWSAFFLGAAGILVARYVRIPFAPLLEWWDGPWMRVALRAAFVAAVPEETVKVAVVALFTLRRHAFAEPMDGVVYGVAVGLGFAACENIGYLAHHGSDWSTLALVRGVLTVPFHAALGAIAGAYISSARFGRALGGRRHDRSRYARQLTIAWLLPVLLHALFDFPILALRGGLSDNAPVRAVFQAAGLIIGFSAIAGAGHLAWRIARHQPPMRIQGLPRAAWRAVWGVLLLGGGVGFLGATLTAAALREGLSTGSYPTIGGLAGPCLVAIAIVLFEWGRRRLLRTAPPPVSHGQSNPVPVDNR